MTQARCAAVAVAVGVELQPASASIETAAIATTEINEVFFISHLSNGLFLWGPTRFKARVFALVPIVGSSNKLKQIQTAFFC